MWSCLFIFDLMKECHFDKKLTNVPDEFSCHHPVDIMQNTVFINLHTFQCRSRPYPFIYFLFHSQLCPIPKVVFMTANCAVLSSTHGKIHPFQSTGHSQQYKLTMKGHQRIILSLISFQSSCHLILFHYLE
jgi:hypothetical protein